MSGKSELYRRRLPHLRVDGAIYAVTFRLDRLQRPLTPSERTLVLSALRYFHGSRYRLDAHVVMDDHVHAILQLLRDYRLRDVLHSWRSFTAHRMSDAGRPVLRGVIWQDDYWDDVLNTPDQYWSTTGYILTNPLRKWPELDGYEWLGTNAEQSIAREDWSAAMAWASGLCRTG